MIPILLEERQPPPYQPRGRLKVLHADHPPPPSPDCAAGTQFPIGISPHLPH